MKTKFKQDDMKTKTSSVSTPVTELEYGPTGLTDGVHGELAAAPAHGDLANMPQPSHPIQNVPPGIHTMFGGATVRGDWRQARVIETMTRRIGAAVRMRWHYCTCKANVDECVRSSRNATTDQRSN